MPSAVIVKLCAVGDSNPSYVFVAGVTMLSVVPLRGSVSTNVQFDSVNSPYTPTFAW